MHEEYRKKLEGEYGPQVHQWTDREITRIMVSRSDPSKYEDYRKEFEGRRRAAMLDAWLRDGGTEREFEREWPSIRTEILRDRALAHEDERERSARVAAREVF